MSWSTTTTNETTSSSSMNSTSSDTSDVDDKEYYIIKSSNPPMNIESTLSFISTSPLNPDMIHHEFRVIDEHIHKTCHQLDHSYLIDQFTFTNIKIGNELNLFIQFIYTRYSTHTWFMCMAFIMVAIHILNTPKEVKKQLLKTQIRFDVKSGIVNNLCFPHCQTTKDAVMTIVFKQEEPIHTIIQKIYHDFNINNEKEQASLIQLVNNLS